MDADQLALRDRIYDVLVAVDGNGDRLFDEDAIAHLQPLFLLQSLQQGVPLDDDSKMELLALAVDAGIDDDDSDAAFHAKIAQYYDDNPIDARLAAAVTRALAGDTAGEPTKRVLAAVLGTPSAVAPGSTAPTGDPRARGVLARALFTDTLTPSDDAAKD